MNGPQKVSTRQCLGRSAPPWAQPQQDPDALKRQRLPTYHRIGGLMSWVRDYGFSDCICCDIVAHKPWEPATFVYEDEEVAVFHNILGWLPVMLLAVPRGLVPDSGGGVRHYEQLELWGRMGRLGAVAMAIGRAYCQIDGEAAFRLFSNIVSL